MKEKARFLGLDVHAETIAVAVAESNGEPIQRRQRFWNQHPLELSGALHLLLQHALARLLFDAVPVDGIQNRKEQSNSCQVRGGEVHAKNHKQRSRDLVVQGPVRESLSCGTGIGDGIDHLRDEGANRQPPARRPQPLPDADPDDDEWKYLNHQNQCGQDGVQAQYSSASAPPEKRQRAI